ncbi:hypothetical protein [Bdellovibrio bacteriovorus]|uniref:hypothetical protein n=1 Tax=Bdellovibrio bacteriovorus TaxID=959 RepID=UPI003AA9AE87
MTAAVGPISRNIASVDSAVLSTIQMLSIRLNNGWDWVKVSFDDPKGLIQIESSFGSYSFIWSAMGDGHTLRTFFVKTDKHYLAEKLWHNSHRETEAFVCSEAFVDLKKRIFKERRDGSLLDWEARDLYDAAVEFQDDLGSDASYERFITAMGESEVLNKWDSEPWHCHYGMRPIGRFVCLRDELIPLIQSEFKKTLDAEAVCRAN